jgi:ApaG protein
MGDYTEITEGIRISVTPIYLKAQSMPHEGFYAWSYHVEIENKSSRTVQLLNRYWRITDGNGRVEEVRGEGVIGQQPVLHPNESFTYASWTHLSTPSGIMQGHYEMEEILDIPAAPDLRGAVFTVAVPAFSLDSDEQLKRPN